MKIKLLFGVIICAALAFTACIEKGEMQPPPPIPVYKTQVYNYNVSLPYLEGYDPTVQKIDSVEMCKFFGITTAQFKTSYTAASKLNYFAIKADTTVDNTAPTTGEKTGHWFDANGSVTTWAVDNGSTLYSNYVNDGFYFNIGQFPKKTTVGQVVTLRQGFLYTPNDLTNLLAVHIFKVTITPAVK